jgi:hypothetical protein
VADKLPELADQLSGLAHQHATRLAHQLSGLADEFSRLAHELSRVANQSARRPYGSGITNQPKYPMPRGDKSSYTAKQKRQVAHIEEGYEKKGLSSKTAEARAWATVNKLTGGGKKSGSGRKAKRK